MEIRQIEAFAAVNASGSVTAAARLLDRSQPVVSRQVQDLEQELGFTLFTRTRPHVTLTEQGRQFLEEVRHVLASLHQLESRAREIATGRSRDLRIAASPSIGPSLLPAVLGELENRGIAFEHKLHLKVVPSEDIVQVLLDGDADVAFTSLPLELGRCRLHWCAQAPTQLAVPANHPLADYSSLGPEDLNGVTIITPSNSSRMRHRLSTALLHPARSPSARQIVSSCTMSAVMMVRAGLGVALVDPCLAAQIQPSGVVYKSLNTYVPYTFGAVTHGERPLHDEALGLIEAVREYVFHHLPEVIEGGSEGAPIMADPHAVVS